jgi:ABC-type uncharacterized transport system permease subunit
MKKKTMTLVWKRMMMLVIMMKKKMRRMRIPHRRFRKRKKI